MRGMNDGADKELAQQVADAQTGIFLRLVFDIWKLLETNDPSFAPLTAPVRTVSENSVIRSPDTGMKNVIHRKDGGVVIQITRNVPTH
jgi:hypothetical protein